jgi:hypothetical protein
MRRFTVGAVALQFDQRRQKGMVVPASHMSSLSRRANEHRVLPASDAQRSQRCSSGSVLAESNIDSIRRRATEGAGW